jgi:hypothetical protein
MSNVPARDVTPNYIELNPQHEAKWFRQKITEAKKAHKYGAAVDVHSVKEYKTHRLFATADGMTGFSVSPSGEMTSVFNHPKSKYGKASKRAAETAVLLGGATHASGFDPALPKAYQAGGFRAVARNAWNKKYKPAGWDAESQGEPDVVFMAADRSAARPKARKYKTGSTPLLSGEDAYDEGMNKAKAVGTSRTAKQIPRAGHFDLGNTEAKS